MNELKERIYIGLFAVVIIVAFISLRPCARPPEQSATTHIELRRAQTELMLPDIQIQAETTCNDLRHDLDTVVQEQLPAKPKEPDVLDSPAIQLEHNQRLATALNRALGI